MGKRQRSLLLISTGGTITMTGSAKGGIVPTLSGEDLVRAVPELGRLAEIEVVAFCSKPGASLTLDDVVAIAKLIDSRLNEGLAGAIVVQGTDTIEETAFVLDRLIVSKKPVVVTGAMRGAASPSADGPGNLLASAIVACAPDSFGRGTLVVLNDEVHAARYVQKVHTSLPSAFASPGIAPIGHVIEGKARYVACLPRLPALPRPVSTAESPVALIRPFLGDDGRLLEAAPDLGLRGIVIEALGAGHLPESYCEKISALSAVMPIILATRVATGPTFKQTYGFAGSEMDLISRGIIPVGDLSGNKAALLLRLLVACGVGNTGLREHFSMQVNG